MAALLNDCGCCEGITAIVPTEVFNRPGQPQVQYRAGTYGEFFASALAALSDPGFAALRELTTRDPDDFTIALLDAWAVVADVLTFYEERIANESYLRTATERQSILELARLIGYTLRPGVAASAYLAFTLEDAQGAPRRTTISIGTKVQSVPGPGEQPQIFETIEAIHARAEWNALTPQTTTPFIPKAATATYLQGVATNLKPGDGLLFVGTERESDPTNDNWDFRLLKSVEPDEENVRTLVTWQKGLGSVLPQVAPAANPRVYAFRQRAAIFGYNAPEWRTIPDTTKALYLGLDDPRELIDEVPINGVPYSEKKEWPNFTIFAPTSTPMPQPVPPREIQPTPESVAAAATAAAAIATQAATDAANNAVKLASDALGQNAPTALQIVITAMADSVVTAIQHFIDNTAEPAVNADMAQDQINDAITYILNQADDLLPANPDLGTVAGWVASGGAAVAPYIAQTISAKNNIPNLGTEPGLDSDDHPIGPTIMLKLAAIVGEIKHVANTQLEAVKNSIPDTAAAAKQTALTSLDSLITAIHDAALIAAAVTQTAVIIATLIKGVLELAEQLQPRDAPSMRTVIDEIADLAADATVQGTSLTTPLPSLSQEANDDLSQFLSLFLVAANIKVSTLGSAVATETGDVVTAVKKAVNEALKPVTLPRPARRDIFKPYPDTIDLDTIYQKITPESWLVLSTPTYQEVYNVTRVVEAARSEYSLTAKTSRVTLEGEKLKEEFEKEVRTTTVFAQSEELEIVETPLREPLYGTMIALSQLAPDLTPKQALGVSGKRAKVMVTSKRVQWVPADGSQSVTLQPGEILSVVSPPRLVPASGGESVALTPEQLVAVLDSSPTPSSPPPIIQWQLMGQDGSVGSVTALFNLINLRPADDDDPIVNEIVFIGTPAGAVTSNRERTIITLNESLQNCYDRATVAIQANLAAATNGETKSEVLGSGDATESFQQFALKQSPLTYIRSTSPSGADSTLQVFVNNVQWHEWPTLYGHGRNERIFSTLTDDAGTTTVEFGDGIKGARLPTGQENVTATYRKGLGTNGNVKAGQLSLLMSRPLGVKAVTNPVAAEGGDDPELLANARQNAPETVLTLDRVVSLQDYEDFSRSYAGIAKALATWTWDGRTRGVFITVAGPLGAAISRGLAQDLITAIHDAGDPFVPVRVESYDEALFKLAAKIKVDPDYETEDVVTAASDALREEFSFANRNFGQPVVLSEVIALLQNVAGIVAVDLDSLYRGQTVGWNNRLEADLPHGGDPASLNPAELLTLDPAPIDLEVML